jgi:hypothetical protein
VTDRLRAMPPFDEFCGDVLGLDLRTRRGHIAIGKALDGLPLTADELRLFQTYTGRELPRAGGYSYGLTLTGRQSGKTEQAAARLAYAATLAVLRGDHGVASVGISQDHRAAQRVLFQYVQRFFDVPLLRGLVTAQTADTVTLTGGVRVLVLPCRPAAIRGLRCVSVVLDEIAHFRSSDNLPLDREAWRASLPTLLTTSGKLLALSSPYGAAGLAFELHRAHYGVVDSDVLVWQSPSMILNPTLSEAAVAQIRAVDPDGAAAEIDGEFLQNVSALLDDEILLAAIDQGVSVRPPIPGVTYVAHADVATGAKSTGDRWTVAIGHFDRRTDCAELDALLIIRPPFSVETAGSQTGALCKAYGILTITADRFAQGFSNETFARAGLRLEPSPASTSDLHLHLAAAIGSGRVRLLDHPELHRELRGLERRRGATKDQVTHRRGAHDDAATVVSGMVMTALSARFARRGIRTFDPFTGAIIDGFDRHGREWRRGAPWSGVWQEFDGKGCALTHPARFDDGLLVEYLVGAESPDWLDLRDQFGAVT